MIPHNPIQSVQLPRDQSDTKICENKSNNDGLGNYPFITVGTQGKMKQINLDTHIMSPCNKKSKGIRNEPGKGWRATKNYLK